MKRVDSETSVSEPKANLDATCLHAGSHSSLGAATAFCLEWASDVILGAQPAKVFDFA